MMRGMNMQGMMKQMQKLQKNMQKDQEELQKTVFEGHAPDDAVVVKFTGDHKMQDIEIKEEAVDPDDVDMLQDVEHAKGTQRLLRNPIKLDGQRLSGAACPPLNADADALLRELGYNDADRAPAECVRQRSR